MAAEERRSNRRGRSIGRRGGPQNEKDDRPVTMMLMIVVFAASKQDAKKRAEQSSNAFYDQLCFTFGSTNSKQLQQRVKGARSVLLLTHTPPTYRTVSSTTSLRIIPSYSTTGFSDAERIGGQPKTRGCLSWSWRAVRGLRPLTRSSPPTEDRASFRRNNSHIAKESSVDAQNSLEYVR